MIVYGEHGGTVGACLAGGEGKGKEARAETCA